MINFIWAGIIVLSILYMLLTKNASEVLVAMTNAGAKAVEICISLAGIYALWMGIMGIVEDSGLEKKISGIAKKVFRPLFRNTSENVMSLMSMNIAANMLGLSNAATPIGLKAIAALKSEERLNDTASDNMIMFIILNTASVQLLPTTVISLRSSMGAAEADAIILPTIITTLVSAAFGIILCTACAKLTKA